MMSRFLSLLVLLSALFAPLPSLAQAPAAGPARPGPQRVDSVEAELIADVAQAVPGQPFRLGLRLKHDPDWHTYWRNPGDSGLPTRFEPTGPAGTEFGAITWPAPRRLAIGDLANYGYENEVVLSRPVALPADSPQSKARFEVLAQWLVCKDVCIPGEAALALELPIGDQVLAAAAGTVALFEESAQRAPGPTAVAATWWQEGTQAYLVLPAGMNPQRAEFFPYFEGVVTPAARQSLMVLGARARTGEVGEVGEAAKADGAGPQGAPALRALQLATAPASSFPEPAGGVLLADGRPVEVTLDPLAAQPVPGKVISVAEVVPSGPQPRPGLLDRLQGRAASSAVTPAGGASQSSSAPDAGGSVSLVLALAGALLGGLILNLMPCVFPVIGLKVLSFSQAGGGEARVARRHALVFSAGVVLSFLLLGVSLLALRSAGAAAGWGFQMQSPLFVGAMALLFVLIGLNLFGVFETGVSLTRLGVPGPVGMPSGAAGRAPGTGQGLSNSFWTGVIAVLVATPCTAPFMGSAVGFTLSSPPGQTLLVFLALGIGMAAPYLVLGWAPRLLRLLPRPGPWLQTFKQFLAFPMLATAAWLTWVLTLQAGPDGLLRLLLSAILLAFAAWVYGRVQSAGSGSTGSRRPGLAGMAAALAAVVISGWQLAQIETVTAPGVTAQAERETGLAPVTAAPAQWQRWSPERVSEALAQGRPVMVDFTAAWCISCQANKKLVLEREAVRRAFDTGKVALLRADWTSRDPAITAELARFGRNGVPLYLVYTSPAQPPQILPELLTVDIVLAALALASP